jgi:hypothetical protein
MSPTPIQAEEDAKVVSRLHRLPRPGKTFDLASLLEHYLISRVMVQRVNE